MSESSRFWFMVVMRIDIHGLSMVHNGALVSWMYKYVTKLYAYKKHDLQSCFKMGNGSLQIFLYFYESYQLCWHYNDSLLNVFFINFHVIRKTN